MVPPLKRFNNVLYFGLWHHLFHVEFTKTELYVEHLHGVISEIMNK